MEWTFLLNWQITGFRVVAELYGFAEKKGGCRLLPTAPSSSRSIRESDLIADIVRRHYIARLLPVRVSRCVWPKGYYCTPMPPLTVSSGPVLAVES